RLDAYNGLLLAPNLDSAFDKGYISFDDSGEMLISGELGSDSRNKLGIHSGMKLRRVEENHRTYLKYHRREVFR
ncbi:MAG: HNH endonuclease, partial [Methanoculleus sp.]